MISMKWPSRDPYQTLGLRPDATEKDIRKAYRRLAMRHHPDRNPDDPRAAERFKQVQWAYEILREIKKKTIVFNRPGQDESYFSDDEHPFIGYFRAMRDYYARKK